VTVTGISGAANVSAGIYHACARTSAGSVLCWGSNLDGQVGDGTETPGYTTPVAVAPISP
jgi:alpha-tubulin suppressor-like RCC1 family protein